MADRVRTLGVGNGMPILPDDSTGGYLFPSQVTASTIIEWYWRVKNWTNPSFAVTATTGLDTKQHFLDADSLVRTFGAATELDLILAPSESKFEATTSGDGSGTGIFNIFDGPSTDKPDYRQVAFDQYFPGFKFAGSITVSSGPGDDATLTWDSDLDSIPSPDGYLTAFVGSDAVPVLIYYKIDANGTGGVILPVGGTFSMAGKEFWPYAAEDMSPIYGSDGSQLQSPLN